MNWDRAAPCPVVFGAAALVALADAPEAAVTPILFKACNTSLIIAAPWEWCPPLLLGPPEMLPVDPDWLDVSADVPDACWLLHSEPAATLPSSMI